MDEVKSIFEPKSVILIGSSKMREKVGMTSPKLFSNVSFNMRKFFKGKTYVQDIDSQKTENSFGDTPELAVIMLPPEESIIRVENWAYKGVRSFIMITGGYKSQQREHLAKVVHKNDLRILGPNTIMGVINSANGLNTTFERDLMPKKGRIAVVSQSGGVGAYLLDWACHYNVGISKFAFVGDKIDVDDVDLLRYFSQDKNTKVICLYIEGARDGRRFVEEAREITKNKPILVLKGGITEESAHRAKSHTSSIAGSDAIFNAAFKKAGIVRVNDIEELMNDAIALSKQPLMKGDNVAIVSNVGGPAILTADAVMREGLKLATLSASVRKEIETTYEGVDAANPIDLIADARRDRYSKALELVLEDPRVDGVLVINMLKSTFFEPSDAMLIPEIAERYPSKPVVDVPAGGEDFERVYRVLAKTNIPVFNLPEKAVKALKALRQSYKIKEKR